MVAPVSDAEFNRRKRCLKISTLFYHFFKVVVPARHIAHRIAAIVYRYYILMYNAEILSTNFGVIISSLVGCQEKNFVIKSADCLRCRLYLVVA